uniref:Uncharacterized protein n=1 Tax=Oryza nivara TaxID=4536 RepID=A0A0E0GBI3_ORYNI
MEVKGSEEDLDPLSDDLPPQAAVSGSRAIGGGPIVSLPLARADLGRSLQAAVAAHVDPPSTVTGVADPTNSSPPAWILSSLRPPLVRINRRRRWEGRIRRHLPLPHISPSSLHPSLARIRRRRRREGWFRRPLPLSHGSHRLFAPATTGGAEAAASPLLSVPATAAQEQSCRGKIGYGTASEALACKLQFIFVRRDYFNEEPFLRILLEHYQSSIGMTRREFLNGYWKLYLLRALTLEPCYDGPTNGGEACRLKLPRILEAVWACGLVDVWKVCGLVD